MNFSVRSSENKYYGTENVLNASIECGVKKCVCLSTDKAAYPINAMGISKAMMEKIVIAKSRTVDSNKTLMCVTRYGNVMASRGSVIPLFIEQIQNGQPMTITDPRMTRYLMSLDEAVELVLYAFQHANTGDLVIQKSPASTIGDLAEAVRKIFDPNHEIKIIDSAWRKAYETL